MAKHTIFTVGYLFPGGDVETVPFESKRSLLDADIIIYEPTLGEIWSPKAYQGKPSLSESQSFAVRQQISHWRRELTEAFEAGKVIFLFLAEKEEVFLDTGERSYSGTGRNQKVTHLVEPGSSYDAFPMQIEVHVRRGENVSAVGDLDFLSAYWAEFGSVSPYEATIEGKFSRELLKARGSSAIVAAAILRGRGAFLLLPPPKYDEDAFTERDPKTKEDYWSEEAQRFGSRLAASLVNVADAIRSGASDSPTPIWAQDDTYLLPREEDIQRKIRDNTEELTRIQTVRSALQAELDEAGRLRRLLYERGKPLEEAILEAIRLLGFKAEPYRDAESDFDIVFNSAEGRFLGEAEGKDNRPINIDKVSQLERNLQEDFAREEVTEFAKGVLFGNAFRLSPPSERGEFFTEKCVAAATRLKVALIRTTDLFGPARYLGGNNDPEYAKLCREAIVSTEGAIVVFPKVPVPVEASNGETINEVG